MKNLARRVGLLVITLVAALAPFAAAAQAWPSQPIRLIVPFAAGSGVDLMARIVAQGLQKELNATVIVDNRPGNSGMIGSAAVAKAAPDGYALLMAGSATHSSVNALFRSVPYDVEADFQPITNFIDADFFLVVKGDSPITSVQELVGWLRANQATASYGFGSATTQAAGEALLRAVNLKATAVPYKGNGLALNDLLGGQIGFMFLDQTLALPQIAAGKVRPLAVAARQRRTDLPNVPTTYERGLDFSITAWIGLMAPAGIPADVRRKLSDASSNLLRDPALRERMAASGRVSSPMTPEQYVAFLKAERASWEARIRAAGIEPQ
jgi:tripartite-type tricarboxylate transporter receptor subunit TctC